MLEYILELKFFTYSLEEFIDCCRHILFFEILYRLKWQSVCTIGSV